MLIQNNLQLGMSLGNNEHRFMSVIKIINGFHLIPLSATWDITISLQTSAQFIDICPGILGLKSWIQH
jgi:hypothetical protein